MKRILLLFIISTLIYFVFIYQNKLSTETITSPSHASQITTNNSEMDIDKLREIIGIINVEAEHNTFTPNIFEIPHTKRLVLEIHAVDQNYTFNLDAFNIHETISKGETKQVQVSGLGVGNFIFDCASGCSGTINVKNLSD